MNFTWKNKTIFITGGTGSWGHELVRQLLQTHADVAQIRIYSRGEHAQVALEREFESKKLHFIIGDVRDLNDLKRAMAGSDVVIHLAALKHVPVCEKNAWEAVRTNILGTQNVIEAALANKVEVVIDVSTDKAVEPFNMYGTTKAVAEKLIINANSNYRTDTRFICLRGGNVINTHGSVIPLFRNQITQQNQITLTDPTMTRFLMSTSEAISQIFDLVTTAHGGEIFVLKMPSVTMETLAQAMIKLYGNSHTKIKSIGPRPGEKTHEVLVSRNEKALTKDFSKNYYVILPTLATPKLLAHYRSYPVMNQPEFSSLNTHQLTQQEISDLIVAESSEQKQPALGI